METTQSQLAVINRLIKENDDIYRAIAHRYHLSDCGFWILYEVCDAEEPLSQKELSQTCYYSKQTINSAIAALQKRGIVTLRPVQGSRNRKHILLTEEGRRFADGPVGDARRVECRALERMNLEERRLLVELLARNVKDTREEFEMLVNAWQKEATDDEDESQHC